MDGVRGLWLLVTVLAALGYSHGSSTEQCTVPAEGRINCHPQPGATQQSCEARGCTWCATDIPNAPWCFFSEDSTYGYSLARNMEKTEKGWRVTLDKRSTVSLFGDDISPIVMDVELQTKDRLRFKVYDPSQERFEVPLSIDAPGVAAEDANYDVEFSSDSSHFRVKRKSTGTVLWDSPLVDLFFSNQYLQITTAVPSTSVYGFGEQEHVSFKHNMDYVTYGMFSRDQAPTPLANLYGVHPFYMCVEDDSNAHGVLLLNSNAQDVSLSPNPSLTFRTIGGILDFYVFLGPTPENVIQQYTEAIGRPHMPAYWSLGFHLSRWGYASLDVVKKTAERMHHYDIPFDVQHFDIDYMDRRLDFTYDKTNYAGLPEYIKELKRAGMHSVIILDPFISKDEEPGTYRPYDLGQEMGVWINNSDGVTPAIGKSLPPGYSVFPDYTNPRTVEWWTQLCLEFKDVLDYDGIWIDMNEPSNDLTGQLPGCAANDVNNPPYIPSITDRSLAQRTLCPDSRTYLGEHYNTHSLFGWSQTAPTFHIVQQATGKRAFVLSRSTFVGSGKHAGHWLGDNNSQWKDMHYSIIGMLEFNLFGIPFVGADICGFGSNTTYELCLRWTQLGSFYPFSRNHNAEGNAAQDPAVFGAEFAKIARATLRIRYSLLPYLYTLFFESHVHGNTVVRSLMHEFTSDQQTHGIDTAFLWGSAFMVAPVLQEGARSVDVYFPEATWFDYYTGKKIPSTWHKTYATVYAPLNKIPLFIRGGHILPEQAPASTTTKSRLNPFGLIIALDEHGEASGSLFWDDGDSIDTIENENYFLARYTFSAGHLKTEILKNGYRGADSLKYNKITILGLKLRPHAIAVNGRAVRSDAFSYELNGKLILGISAPLTHELNLAIY
ncbi:sucrase-isomaltase, intestinal-like [Meleagris gallopavo]|uniref:sucrase-isomaltase, intestinal-like n=1 Tax=Meleagris gallopavo TaxID=9103 RepID=UPI000549D87C|nr:sucrase-isomaltase, intestinal-like [Meleagris gallopavo]